MTIDDLKPLAQAFELIESFHSSGRKSILATYKVNPHQILSVIEPLNRYSETYRSIFSEKFGSKKQEWITKPEALTDYLDTVASSNYREEYNKVLRALTSSIPYHYMLSPTQASELQQIQTTVTGSPSQKIQMIQKFVNKLDKTPKRLTANEIELEKTTGKDLHYIENKDSKHSTPEQLAETDRFFNEQAKKQGIETPSPSDLVQSEGLIIPKQSSPEELILPDKPSSRDLILPEGENVNTGGEVQPIPEGNRPASRARRSLLLPSQNQKSQEDLSSSLILPKWYEENRKKQEEILSPKVLDESIEITPNQALDFQSSDITTPFILTAEEVPEHEIGSRRAVSQTPPLQTRLGRMRSVLMSPGAQEARSQLAISGMRASNTLNSVAKSMLGSGIRSLTGNTLGAAGATATKAIPVAGQVILAAQAAGWLKKHWKVIACIVAFILLGTGMPLLGDPLFNDEFFKPSLYCSPFAQGCGGKGPLTPPITSDFSVFKTGDERVDNGQEINYTLSVSYSGIGTASAQLKDRPPAYTSYKVGSASDGGAPDKDGYITWTLNNISSVQPTKVTFTVTPVSDHKDFWAVNQATLNVLSTNFGSGLGMICENIDQRLSNFLEAAGVHANVPPALVFAFAEAENGGSLQPWSLVGKLHPISPCGAHGIMQIQHIYDGTNKNYGITCAEIGGTPNPPEIWNGLSTSYNSASGGKINNADYDEDSIWGGAYFLRKNVMDTISSLQSKGANDHLDDIDLQTIAIRYLGGSNTAYTNEIINYYNDAIAKQGTCTSK